MPHNCGASTRRPIPSIPVRGPPTPQSYGSRYPRSGRGKKRATNGAPQVGDVPGPNFRWPRCNIRLGFVALGGTRRLPMLSQGLFCMPDQAVRLAYSDVRNSRCTWSDDRYFPFKGTLSTTTECSKRSSICSPAFRSCHPIEPRRDGHPLPASPTTPSSGI